MKIAYPMRFQPEPGGGITVLGIGDMDGIATFGETLQEAREMAQEALMVTLEAMLEDGRQIPRPESAEGDDIQWVSPDPSIVAPLLLRWARQDVGITQGELARRLGIKQQSAAEWEKPGANLSINTLARAAKALGKELDISLV